MKFSITINGENKIFHNNSRFKQYLSTNVVLQKVLDGKLQPRKITVPTKTQQTDNLRTAKSTEGKHTNTTTEK